MITDRFNHETVNLSQSCVRKCSCLSRHELRIVINLNCCQLSAVFITESPSASTEQENPTQADMMNFEKDGRENG
jgi:hypothetical protein